MSSPQAASPSQQGIGAVRDSLVSCLEDHQRLADYVGERQGDFGAKESESEVKPGQSSRGWLRKGAFWKRPHSRRRRVSDQSRVLFYEGSFWAKMEDLDLLEILILVAKAPTKVRRELVDTLVNNLSSLVSSYIKRTENSSDSSSSVLDERLLQEIKTCLHRRIETTTALADKDMPESQRLRCLHTMIGEATQQLSLAGLRFQVSQFWELFEHLPWGAQERVVEGYFHGEREDFLVQCVNQAMIESQNPFRVQALFRLHDRDKKRDCCSQEAIALHIEQLARENPRALAYIQRNYYYETALFRRVYREMREGLEENPGLLDPALRRAIGTAKSPFFRHFR